MTDSVQEISTDYDLDYEDDDSGPHDDPLRILDEEISDINQFGDQLGVLIESTMMIDQFGMSSSSFAVMKASDLLSGTALECLGTEHFSAKPDHSPESDMALEALLDKIKDKAAAWAAKIMTFVKNTSTKIIGGLGRVMETIIGYGKSLTDKAWDASKAAVATVKAHPVKTILAVVAAAAVVAGIVVMCSSGSFADKNAIKALLTQIKDRINGKLKWPFGTIEAEVVTSTRSFEVYNLTTKTTSTVEYAVRTETIKQLGWGQSVVKAVMSQLSTVWSSLKTGVGGLINPVVKTVKKVDAIGGDMKDLAGAVVANKTGSKLAGWAANKWVEKMYMTALWSVVGVVTKLLHSVVMKAFQMVKETFSSLKSNVEATA